MDNYSYQLTNTAQNDIERISQYIIENFYVETAISVMKEIRVKIAKVCNNPFVYEEREIFSKYFGEIRIATAKKYNIYFAVDEKTKIVYIVRVAHCTMNLLKDFIDGMSDE